MLQLLLELPVHSNQKDQFIPDSPLRSQTPPGELCHQTLTLNHYQFKRLDAPMTHFLQSHRGPLAPRVSTLPRRTPKVLETLARPLFLSQPSASSLQSSRPTPPFQNSQTLPLLFSLLPSPGINDPTAHPSCNNPPDQPSTPSPPPSLPPQSLRPEPPLPPDPPGLHHALHRATTNPPHTTMHSLYSPTTPGPNPARAPHLPPKPTH